MYAEQMVVSVMCIQWKLSPVKPLLSVGLTCWSHGSGSNTKCLTWNAGYSKHHSCSCVSVGCSVSDCYFVWFNCACISACCAVYSPTGDTRLCCCWFNQHHLCFYSSGFSCFRPVSLLHGKHQSLSCLFAFFVHRYSPLCCDTVSVCVDHSVLPVSKTRSLYRNSLFRLGVPPVP